MTVQPAPPIIGERQISNHECVPASLACALQSVGHAVQVQDIVTWLTTLGYDTSNGVTIEHAAAYCKAFGIPYEWDDGIVPMTTYVPAALNAGYPVIGFHQCDGNANPVPVGTSGAVEHCRRFYGDDVGAYQTMNPWPPDLEAVAQSTMNAADVRVHLTIQLPVLGDSPMPMDQNTAFGCAKVIALDTFGRGIGTDIVGQIAADVVNLGFAPAWDKWAAITQQNGEINLLARVDNLQQSPGVAPQHSHPGGSVTAHTHPLSGGTTGPAQ